MVANYPYDTAVLSVLDNDAIEFYSGIKDILKLVLMHSVETAQPHFLTEIV